MIILIQDRKDNYHIADYQSASGTKYTICGLIYSRKDIINTFSLGASVRIICDKCHASLEQSNEYMQKRYLRQHYDKLEIRLKSRYTMIQNRRFGTAIEFEDYSERFWNKLNSYKRKLSRRGHDLKYK